jgi:zinc transport system substrate-binding protein
MRMIDLTQAVPLLLLLLPGMVGGCGTATDTETAGPASVRVFVSIPPIQGIVSAIGGQHVESNALIAGGQNPHTYEPTPTQMVALAGARLYLRIGLPFEDTLIERIEPAAGGPLILDASEGIERRAMRSPGDDMAHDHGDAHAHDHGDAHAHDHGGAHAHDHGGGHSAGDCTDQHLDPHVWMSPGNLKLIAGNIARALAAVDSARASTYQANLARFQQQVTAIEDTLASQLAPLAGESVYVFHPAFGYFTDAYGLVQRPVEIEGKEPTPKQLSHLIAQARKDRARLLIVQPQFDPRSAEAVSDAIGGSVVAIDPLSADILGELRKLASVILREGSVEQADN